MPIHTLHRLVATVAGKLPLRIVLIVPFALQIVGTVGLVGYFSYKDGYEDAHELATQLQFTVNSRIVHHLDSYLATPAQLNKINVDAYELGLLNFSDFKRSGQFFWRQVQAFNVSYINFATPKGEFIGAGYYGQGKIQIEEIPKNTKGKSYKYDTDKKGNRTRLLSVQDFNPHAESWYLKAARTGKPVWSDIYNWDTNPEILSIAASYPLYNEKKTLIGVTGVDLKLSQISNFLKTLNIGKSGRAFIIERSGLLVASSAKEPSFTMVNGKAQRLNSLNSRIPVIQQTAQYLQKHFGNLGKIQTSHQLTFDLSGEHQAVQISPWGDKLGLDWLVVVVISNSDFEESIYRDIRFVILVAIGTFILAIVNGIIAAGWITNPILRLNIAAKNIAKGEWDKVIEISRSDEVGQLAKSFNQMAEQLQQSFAELSSLNEVLAQSERRFRTLFESTPKIPVQGYNRYRQVIFWNKASEELYGYTQDEALGKTLEELIIPHELWQEVIPAVDAWIAGGSALPSGEVELRRKDGSTVTVYSSHIMLTNTDGEPELYCIDIDLSDRKQAENLLANYNRTLEAQVAQRTAALEESERSLSTLLANLPGYVYRVANDPNYTPEFISEGVFSITGYRQEEYLVNRTISCGQEIHPADADSVWDIVQNAVEARQSYECEYRIITKSGTQKWVWERGQGIYAENGELRFLEGFVTDISDKKLAEAALQANQRRYQTLTEASPVCIFHTDALGNCIYVNQRWSEITGLSLEEAYESGWAKTLHPDDRDRVFAEWYEAAAAQVPFKSEYRFLRPDGTITWVIGQGVPELGNHGEVIGYVGTITDINERKQVEQELRQLSTALENAVEGISLLDTQGRYVTVNKAYASITGYQPDEMIGMEWPRTVHPDECEKMIAAYQEMLEVGKVEAQTRGIRKDGSIFYKQLVMVTAYDEQHNFIGHYCFMKDISDKKQAEEAIQYQLAVIEAATDGIAILNDHSEYTYLNQAHVTLFGYSNANELIGKTWKELYYPEEISRFERDIFPILMQQGHWQGEATGKKQDGTTFAEEISLTLIEGKGLICVCQDITERKRAELELQEREYRLRTLGDNLPNGLIYQLVHEPNGNYYFSYISAGIERLVGVKPEAVMQDASNLHNLIVEDDRLLCEQLTEQSRRNLSIFQMQMRKRKPSGEIQWSYLRSAPRRLEDGRTIWDGIEVDITTLKKAEEALRENAQREKAIATIIQQMRQTLDIETIFTATTEELRHVMKCDRVVVFQFNSDWSGQFVAESMGDGWISLMQQQINSQATDKLLNDPRCTVKTTILRDIPAPVIDSYLQETKSGVYSQCVNYRITQDIYQSGFSPCYIELLERFQIRAYIIVPIYCGNQLWGLLANYQNSNSRAWSEAEINTVVQIGIQLGVALQQAQLLKETQQQAIQLQHAAYAAQAANRAKSQFLANMSHELRTPLNGILGYAQILQADKNCTPKQQKGVGIIHQCGTHLLTLINDILDLSKIEAGKLELYPEDFHFPSLLTSLSEIFQIKAAQKSITFTYLPLNQLPKLIHADEKRLRQVLMNLLSNAVKFTDSGSVTFKVGVLKNGEGGIGNDDKKEFAQTSIPNSQSPIPNPQFPIRKIRFQVEDTGIGISAEHLEKIFLPFEQVGDSSRRAEGTGLGLAITQKIVELMGSKLFVESTPGVGSTFWFDLEVPVVSTPMQSITVKSTDTIIGYSGSKRKILIVDDYWENLTVLLNMLEPIGFEIEQAVDGQEGLEKAVDCQPDLILVDLVMPVMDGYQMTRQLRQLPEFQDIIIIAISANVFERDRLQSLDAGCNDFLPKPVRAEDLLDKIKHYLNLSWIYDSESNTPAQTLGDESSRYPQVEPKEMVIPPKEELLALYEATNTGHVNGVKEEALRLQQLNSDYSPFATRILELAADFEYEEIVNLIDPYLL